MNWYNVTVEGHGSITVKASGLRVAINKVLSRRDIKLLDGARVAAWKGSKVKYQYFINGYIELSDGSKVWGKISPNFSTRKQAVAHQILTEVYGRIGMMVIQP